MKGEQTMKERLIELLTDNLGDGYNPLRNFHKEMCVKLADHLIENGLVLDCYIPHINTMKPSCRNCLNYRSKKCGLYKKEREEQQ